MFGLATVYVADVKLIGVQIVNVHVIPQGYLDQSDSNGTSASFFFYRPYSVPGEGQVHENPEWEKARQALASINKNQSPAKAAQANQTPAQVTLKSIQITN